MLFHYFGNTDLVGHIVWRSMDPEHPAYDAEEDAHYAEVMPDLYRRMDEVVGHTLENMPENTLLVVMSDHGFAPWRRVMHLNAWLAENGYLTMKDPSKRARTTPMWTGPRPGPTASASTASTSTSRAAR